MQRWRESSKILSGALAVTRVSSSLGLQPSCYTLPGSCPEGPCQAEALCTWPVHLRGLKDF